MLKSEFTDDEPIYLILDRYSVHGSQEIRNVAPSLGIIMKFISDCMIDSLQPFDRAVFGTLNAPARRMFRMGATDCVGSRLTTQLAVQFLSRAWEQVTTEVLDRAWQTYESDDNEE
jgi:hypothetical protein